MYAQDPGARIDALVDDWCGLSGSKILVFRNLNSQLGYMQAGTREVLEIVTLDPVFNRPVFLESIKYQTFPRWSWPLACAGCEHVDWSTLIWHVSCVGHSKFSTLLKAKSGMAEPKFARHIVIRGLWQCCCQPAGPGMHVSEVLWHSPLSFAHARRAKLSPM